MKSVFRYSWLLYLSFFFFGCAKDNTPSAQVAKIDIPTYPLQSVQDLDVIINQIGDARVVLLGEASHGTAEYYEWRAALSKRLIQEKGFDFIGVEGEWADNYRVNQFIKGPQKDSIATVTLLRQYDRWPTWMWGNAEVASLVTWLNNYNQGKALVDKVGFYGLDVYCLWESMQELMPYIQSNDSLMQIAHQVQRCFRPYSADPMEYAYAVADENVNCRAQTERLHQAIMSFSGGSATTTESNFVMQQNALVALNGERYYRASVSSYPGSWNIRDQHMAQTIQRLLDFHGPNSKIIIWEHNTHVGDARFTDMFAQGMVNVGQLAREAYGPQNVYIVGFGSYQGSVIAADEWGGAIKTMNVPQAQRGSWEYLLHQISPTNKIILSSEIKENETLSQPIGNRAIGVVYNPRQEAGNYVPSVIPDRYDAFVFIDQTKALRPLGTTARQEPPDTYPSGY